MTEGALKGPHQPTTSGTQKWKQAPEGVTAQFRQTAFTHRRVIQRQKPCDLESGPARRDRRQLSLAVVGDRQGIPFALLPFPQRGSQRQFQPLTGHLMESIDEVFPVLLHLAPFDDHREDELVSPPAQGSKGELLVAQEMFRVVQVLIGAMLQMLALDELHFG